MFTDKVVAITGGTGSFGQHILKGFLATDVAEIRIFSRDEKKQEEMRTLYNDAKLKFYIGDVRAYDSINQALKGAHFVFHAAALKQVPSCEFYPLEAVRTNILGTENVMSAAIANRVEKVVVLSTDKAVYPINAMGQTKALMEKVMVAKSRSLSSVETLLCATRYGNVMVSRGSVIPLFVSQIKAGKPLTITDPNMTRFLMSLDDSVDLVLHAYGHGKQGDIFVQKAPAATIGDLVQALKEIFNADNPVQIVGTRHGEKLYESLVSREEMARVQDMQQYYRIPADNRDLNYAMYFTEGEKQISALSDYTSHNTERLSVAQVKELLLKLDFIQRHLRGQSILRSQKSNALFGNRPRGMIVVVGTTQEHPRRACRRMEPDDRGSPVLWTSYGSWVSNQPVCAFCDSKRLGLVMDFGEVGLAGAFLKPEQFATERTFPMRLHFCKDCYAVQVTDKVPPDVMFQNYFYFSSSIGTLRDHFIEFAAEVTRRFLDPAKATVLEFGCNDGRAAIASVGGIRASAPLMRCRPGVERCRHDQRSPHQRDPELFHRRCCASGRCRIRQGRPGRRQQRVRSHSGHSELTRAIAEALHPDGIFAFGVLNGQSNR